MYAKCDFLNGFQDHTLLDHVFILIKALYGLKHAPHAWYDKMSSFLLKNSFMRDKVDTILLRREVDKYIIIFQIYVDDNILELLINLYARTFLI